jgi:hypothetical protein
LTNIAVDASNSVYRSVAGVVYNQDQTTLVQCPGGAAGGFTVPNSVTNLADASFHGCRSLTSVTIPDTVLSLGKYAFQTCTALTNVIIPSSLTIIADYAFESCINLTSVKIPDGVTSIGNYGFSECTGLTNVTIPGSVTSLGNSAFDGCSSLHSVTLPRNVTALGYGAFDDCPSLTAVFFMGDAIPGGFYAFYSGVNATLYYLPGALGWDQWFFGPPAVLWNPQAQPNDASFGVRANQFGFPITGATNLPIVIEASTSLASGVWVPLQSCTLTNGSLYFSDPQWANYPVRFYRLRSP